MPEYDAVVVGSGPNGLAAAVTLAQSGASVLVIEGYDKPGGGTRSAELTLPGFVHDVCSAIHPLGVASPFFRDLPLDQFGLEWIFPPAALAHPLDDGTAVVVRQSFEETAETLGRDAGAYKRLLGPFARNYTKVIADLLGPLRPPRYPVTLGRIGMPSLLPAKTLAKLAFRGERGRAVFSGLAAHAIMPLERPGTAAFGMMLGMLAHAVGWPMAKGGSQAIADSLVAYLKSLGGQVKTGWTVERIEELPSADAYLFDVTPRQLLKIAGHRLPDGYKRQLQAYRYGPGVFKLDYALSGPVPWTAQGVREAGTVHLGGTVDEIAASEHAAFHGTHHERPYVLVVQQTPFDPSRAPEGKHTLWAYSHVPNGSTVDMTERIENQIERFAPGFRDLILEKHTFRAADWQGYNPNYIGGDINGGVQDLGQLFTRPVVRLTPYNTSTRDIFLCSSSTPPGGGVHGMCGYFAAQAAMRALGVRSDQHVEESLPTLTSG